MCVECRLPRLRSALNPARMLSQDGHRRLLQLARVAMIEWAAINRFRARAAATGRCVGICALASVNPVLKDLSRANVWVPRGVRP